MVRGAEPAVTAVPGTNQCAEIDRIALGLGRLAPITRQASANSPPRAFMGLPWPKKIAGIGCRPALMSEQRAPLARGSCASGALVRLGAGQPSKQSQRSVGT